MEEKVRNSQLGGGVEVAVSQVSLTGRGQV